MPEGLVVLIAGVPGGMGALLLKRLDAGGLQGRKVELIIALDFFPRKEIAEDLQKRLKTRNLVLHWDAASFDSTRSVTQAIDKAVQRIDAVLITTGIGFHGDINGANAMSLEDSDRVLQRLLAVNAVGPSLLSQWCASKLQTSIYRTRTMLLLSSFSGVVGLPHRAAYCASKFALNGYLESVHAEFPDLNIVLVCPTSVATSFRDNWKADMQSRGVAIADVKVNSADLTAEDCVSAVWTEFDRVAAHGSLRYAILPKGKTAFSYWAVRVPFLGQLVRPRIIARSSKL